MGKRIEGWSHTNPLKASSNNLDDKISNEKKNCQKNVKKMSLKRPELTWRCSECFKIKMLKNGKKMFLKCPGGGLGRRQAKSVRECPENVQKMSLDI